MSSHQLPFVALDVKRVRGSAEDLDAAVGLLRARVNGRFERQRRRGLKADVVSLLRMLRQLLPTFAKWCWRGSRRKLPFVHSDTLQPIVTVEQLEAPKALRLAGCR